MNNFLITQFLNFLLKIQDKKFPQKITYVIIKNIQVLQKNYDIYEQSLQKLFDQYKSYTKTDKNGKTIVDKNQIPIVEEKMQKSFYKEIEDLLNMKVDINLYTISENFFNYDDKAGLYDILTPQELLQLQEILCKKKSKGKKEKKSNNY